MRSKKEKTDDPRQANGKWYRGKQSQKRRYRSAKVKKTRFPLYIKRIHPFYPKKTVKDSMATRVFAGIFRPWTAPLSFFQAIF